MEKLKVFKLDRILIHIIDLHNKKHTIHVDVDSNLSLMEVVKDAGFEMGNCGGMALCASCHCYIALNKNLPEKTTEELDMLDQLHNTNIDESRLICQIKIDKKLNGITLKIVQD